MDDLILVAVRMAITAATVVGASVIAQRSGPLLGAVVICLPISAGPGYVFLAASGAGDAFVAASALHSFAAQSATALFLGAYARAAPRCGAFTTLALAFLPWCLVVAAMGWLDPDWRLGLVLNVLGYLAAFRLAGPAPEVVTRAATRPSLGDLVFRACLVGALVATTVGASRILGPGATGVALTFPISLSSLGTILHLRQGGTAAAATLRASLGVMTGFTACILAVHLTAVPLGAWTALGVGLAISLAASVAFTLAPRLSALTPRASFPRRH